MSRQLGVVRAVVGILLRDGKVLVAERPVGKPYSGYWEFPGGKIEAHESSVDALIRELQEEIGVTVINPILWHQHSHDYPDKTVELDLYLITEFLGEPHGKENQQLRWVAKNEFPALKLLEGNLAFVEKINSLL